MFCALCGANNRENANFCKKCGMNLGDAKFAKIPPQDVKIALSNPVSVTKLDNDTKEGKSASPHKNLDNLSSDAPQINIKLALGVAVILLAIFISPAKAYYGYFKNIRSAENLVKSGDYSTALTKLKTISEHGLYKSFKASLKFKIEKYSEFKRYGEVFDQAIKAESQDDLDKAKGLLTSISDKKEYPKFSDVNKELAKVNDAITKKVEVDANAKVAKAEQQVSLEAQRRQQAQQQADQAAAQAAANQAAAQAAQAQADAAAVAAKQAAQQKAREVRISFRSQLVTAYNIFNNEALPAYRSGIQYSNNNDSVLAISQMTSARTALNSAKRSVSDLNSRFTGLPSEYYNAADDMNTAIDYLSRACDLLVETEGTSLDWSSSVNLNKNNAFAYLAKVKAFLDSSAY